MTTDSGETQGFFKPSIAEPSGPDRFSDTPLLDFWDTGAGYEVKGGKSAKGNVWQRIHFRGSDTQVVKASDVYPMMTSELQIFYNDPGNSPRRKTNRGISEWESFSESIREIYQNVLPAERMNEALDDIWGGQVVGEGSAPSKPGKRYHLVRVPTLLNVGPDEDGAAEAEASGNLVEAAALRKWHDAEVPAWKVVEVIGVGKLAGYGEGGSIPSSNGSSTATATQNNLLEYILGLADGKPEAKFYEAALDDEQVLANPTLTTQLTSRDFHRQMIQLGKMTQDADSTLHKV